MSYHSQLDRQRTPIYTGSSTSYEVSLEYDTTYTWQVTAFDAESHTESPIWTFATETYVPPPPPNTPPSQPDLTTPAHGLNDLPVTTTLSWTATDPDNDPLTVYLGPTDGQRTPIYTGSSTSYEVSLEYDTTYTWQVTAFDHDTSTPSLPWQFKTCAKPEVNDWTLIIYLDGDNNLEYYANLELQEILLVDYGEDCTVIALIDGKGPDNSQVHIINEGHHYELPPSTLNINYDNEVNMGSSTTLQEVVEFAFAEYPAKQYLLELWNHGYGWRGICRDEYDNDRLTLSEIRDVVAEACGNYHEKIDVLVYTACTMAELECVYGLGSYVDYFVGSQETILATGMPHEEIFGNIGHNSELNAIEVCHVIVDAYSSYYRNTHDATIAVWQLSNIESLNGAVDRFAQVLIGKMATQSQNIKTALESSESFEGIGYRDLYDFALNVQTNCPGDAEIERAAEAVLQNISKVVQCEWHGNYHDNAHGISIYLPNVGSYVFLYEDTQFAVNTHWDEWLQTW